MSKNDMSFLPADYVERRIEQRTNVICLTLFGVVLIGVVGAYVVTSRHRAEVKDQRAKVNAAYADAARRIEQAEELRKRRAQMLRKAEVTGRLQEKVPRTNLLADLINRMPPTLSLFELDLVSQVEKSTLPRVRRSSSALKNKKDADAAPAPDPVPSYTVTMRLIGVAPTDVQVAQYMSSLSRSELLSEVNLRFSEETKIEDATMRKFHIDMTLSGEADMRKIEPLLANRKLKLNPLDDPTQARSVITPQGPALGGVDIRKED